jgi:hypothetical protein
MLDPSSAILGCCILGELAASAELMRLVSGAGTDDAMFSRLGSMQAGFGLYSASLAKNDACGMGKGNCEPRLLGRNTGVTSLGISVKLSSEENTKPGGTDSGSC